MILPPSEDIQYDIHQENIAPVSPVPFIDLFQLLRSLFHSEDPNTVVITFFSRFRIFY